MKKFTLICCVALVVVSFCILPASGAQSVKISDLPSAATLLEQDQSGLSMSVDVGSIDFFDVNTPEGIFTLMTVGGFVRSQRIGEPNLPTLNRLISIPYGCDLDVEVIDSQFEDFTLADLDITSPIIPAQPSLSKSQDPDDVPFEYNRALYQQPGYYSQPLAAAEIVGIMRSMRLARVVIAPFQYSPSENKLRVYKSVTIRVNFIGADWASTREIWRRYYSPFFTPVYERVFNYGGQESMLLDDLTRYPQKYVIISDRMFEAQLQPFIEWKIKKGFTVITGYTDDIGYSNTAIKTFIRDLYDNGNPDDPAPSFVLFVGDAQQIPPFPHSGHISDLDFCEYTNDNIPEIYYGRFSAQNTGQLQPQIDKTLEYEQYLMPDPSFLGVVTMIAGVDANFAPVWGNGQINYGTSLYFNEAHGIHSNTWLYPESAGPVESAIIQTINEGLSYINYTAHGSHDSWADPTLTSSNVNALTNSHKYPLAVGNCCLTNTFGTDYGTPCLGETWLQAPNKGAVGYIGASNSSYWDEDYWWGVGYGPIVSNPTYEENGIGAYDGMFHDHGEPVALHYVTNDAINFCGNMAVTESGSGMIAYYWQIYHLMGDPSVMTYFGVPAANNVIHDPTLIFTATSITVHADPGSYVGISLDGVLHGAAYIDSSGFADVALEPFSGPGVADIVVTAQNRVPYIATIQIIAPEGPYVIYDSNTINDSGGNNNGLVDFGEHIILGVQLRNVGPDTAFNVVAELSTNDAFVTVTDNSEPYGTILGNNGTANRPSAFAFDVAGSIPDGHLIQFDLTVSSSEPDLWISHFVIPAHAPAISVMRMIVDDHAGNNNGILDPGETAEITVWVRNSGSAQAYSVVGVLSESDPYVTIDDPDGTFGDIAPGDSAENSADLFIASANTSCPMGHDLTLTLDLSGSSGFAVSLSIPMIVGDREVFFSDDFSSNLGWTGLGGTAEWTIGFASGGRGNDSYGGPDPSADHSPTDDNRVLGNDLTSGTGGDYNAGISSTQWVTSPTIDCSNYAGVIMTYYHWLGVEQNSYDHAYLQAYNGTAWVTLFESSSTTIDESSWNTEEYDLSQIADLNSNFKIRYGLGSTDGSWQYCGWNIDDVSLKGYNQGVSGNPELSFSISSIADSLVQGDSALWEFSIRNTGDGVLRVHFTCDDDWMRFSDAQIEVPPFDSATFSVLILSGTLGPGIHNCTLDYTSNDSDNPSGSLPVAIFIYSPNIQIPQAQVADTLQSNQQSYFPLVIDNTGPGRLFYGISVETSRISSVSLARSPVSDADAGGKPLGYRLGDPGKSSAVEPYYPPVIADEGGPDQFGYRWIDSDEPGGPTYNWVDITGIGTPISVSGDDDNSGPYEIGFDFSFYGNTFNSFRFCSNGFLSFSSTDNEYDNTSIPSSSAPFDLLAVLWDDLYFPGGGSAYYYSNNSDSLVVSYIDVPHFSSGGPYTFQVILTGRNIIFHYQTVNSPDNSCTVGIQNSDGSDGLQVVYNAAYLHNDLAIRFSALTWLSVFPESGTIDPFSSDSVQVMFDATDLADSLYSGQLVVSSNDPQTPNIVIPASLLVGPQGGGCHYVPGDINFNGQANGVDVGYAVNYFKGFGPEPPIVCPDCPNSGQQLFGAGDVNASCIFNGVDVTYFVNYLKGVGPALQYCPNCPPTIDVPNLGIGDPSRPIIRAKTSPMNGNSEK